MFRYMNRVTLPDWIRNSHELATLCREATVLCSIINDLYSAPKEIVIFIFPDGIIDDVCFANLFLFFLI